MLKESFLDLQKFVMESFLGEFALRNESSRTLCNSIVNSGDVDEYNQKRYYCAARYASTYKFFIKHMETDEKSL